MGGPRQLRLGSVCTPACALGPRPSTAAGLRSARRAGLVAHVRRDRRPAGYRPRVLRSCRDAEWLARRAGQRSFRGPADSEGVGRLPPPHAATAPAWPGWRDLRQQRPGSVLRLRIDFRATFSRSRTTLNSSRSFGDCAVAAIVGAYGRARMCFEIGPLLGIGHRCLVLPASAGSLSTFQRGRWIDGPYSYIGRRL